MFLFQVFGTDFKPQIESYKSALEQLYSENKNGNQRELDKFYSRVETLYNSITKENKSNPLLPEAAALCQVLCAWLQRSYEGIGVTKNSANLAKWGNELGGNFDSFPDFAGLQAQNIDWLKSVVGVKESNDVTELVVPTTSRIMSPGFKKMVQQTYDIFDHLNFNVLDGKVKEGTQNLSEYITDLLSFYDKVKGDSTNKEELAFCYAAFKWLSAMQGDLAKKDFPLGLPDLTGPMKEIRGMDAVKGREYKEKLSYYAKYFDVLRRSVISDVNSEEVRVVRFHLNEKGVDRLAKLVDIGNMEEEATFTFTTKKGAEIFQSQILDKMGGVSFTSRISEEGGQFVVYFQGRSDPKKEAGDYNETFSNELMGEMEVSNINNFTVGTHGESQVKTKYEGDAAKYTDAEMFEVTKGKDIDFSTGKGKAYLETFVALTLAVHNYAPNEESREEMEHYTRAAFRQLAEKCGYSGDNAIEDFLKSSDGEAFVAELRAAIKRGDFMFFTSASSEWLVSQGGLKDLTVSQIGNSQQRGDLALEYINELLVNAGQQQISGVPIVRVVWPLEPLSDKDRDKLISLGMEQISAYPKEVKDRVRGYLAQHYSNENISANFQRIFGQVYSDAQNGDADAVKAWNALKKSAISVDLSGDEPVFSIKNSSALNTLISLKHSPIRKNGSYFDNVLGETTRYASFEMAADMDVSITIGKGEKKGDLMYVPIEVSQNAAWKTGGKETKFEGMVDGSVWTEGGKKVTDATFSVIDGKWYAVFKPEAGVKYSVVAYATNDQNTISTGLVKRGVEAEDMEIWHPYVNGKSAKGLPGTYVDLPFTAFKRVYDNEKDEAPSRQEGVDSRLAFAVILKGESTPKYFECPGEVEISQELVYTIPEKNVRQVLMGKPPAGAQSIIVDRGLTAGDRTYSKSELVRLAKEGVVAIKTPNVFGTGFIWVSLDGKVEVTADGLSEKDGFLYSQKPVYSMRDVLQTSPASEPNISLYSLDGRAANQEKSLIYRSILIPENDVRLGDKSYSPRQLRNLVKEHIIAVVQDKMVNGSKVATVYGIDGREIGPLYGISLEPSVPLHLNGLFLRRPSSDKFEFNWKTYIPNMDDIEEVKGYIYSEQAMGSRQPKGRK